MATTKHYVGESVTFTEAAATNNVTSALPAPGAGRSWRIDNITFRAAGAITAWDLDVQESGGTSCWRVGATTAVYPGQFTGPIATKINDAPNVVMSATGATAVQLNIIATLV